MAARLNLGLSYAVIQQYKLFQAEMSWVMAKAPKEALPYCYLGRYYSKELEQLDRGLELFRERLIATPTILSHVIIWAMFPS